jgi:hypothetical protein
MGPLLPLAWRLERYLIICCGNQVARAGNA